MKITWTDRNGNEITGRIDAALWPYVKALGVDKAARFFIRFGGSYIYIGRKRANGTSEVAAVLGPVASQQLIESGVGPGSVRVPLANGFPARYLRSRGRTVNQICRAVRCTDVQVRGLLKADHARRDASIRMEAKRRETYLADAELLASLPQALTQPQGPQP
ncbi:hypothetical protein C7449_104128 [Mycoplana dimorpha]|uniref:Uncharacterized protein n=2 Tax=Mycoplana dimorpha TaxID=28320 RepID=A0A2T5B7U3_MYCDI|nr:hypothetical protein C7449_104128 [Mycoplana dimorpha]